MATTRRAIFAVAVAALCLFLSAGIAVAQDEELPTTPDPGINRDLDLLERQSDTTARPTRAQQPNPFLPMFNSQRELAAFRAIEEEQQPAARLPLIDTFLNEFPESQLKHLALGQRVQALVEAGNNQAVIAAATEALAAETAFHELVLGEVPDAAGHEEYPAFMQEYANSRRFLEQSLMLAYNRTNQFAQAIEHADLAFAAGEEFWEYQSQTLQQGSPEYQEALENFRASQLFFVQTAMTAQQNMNNAEGTVEYARKALELDPENLVTLITISSVMAERPPAERRARDQHLDEAREYAAKAIEKVDQLLASPVGAQISAQQRAGLQSNAHATLGLIYLHKEEFGDAQAQYEEALSINPNDPIGQYRLGFAYAKDNKLDDAMEALGRSVFLKGVTEAEARTLLEQLYQAANNSLDGLDAFIQRQGEEIGRN